MPRLADARLRHEGRSEPRVREMTVALPELHLPAARTSLLHFDRLGTLLRDAVALCGGPCGG